MTLYNLVRMHTATVGTADIVVTTAVAGYKDCTDVPNGAAVTYTVFNVVSGAATDSEQGHGTWNSATQTIARTTVLDSTNGNNKIVLIGTGQVALTLADVDLDVDIRATDPASPRDGQMWLLKTATTAAVPIGMLMMINQTSITGYTRQLSVNDGGTIVRATLS